MRPRRVRRIDLELRGTDLFPKIAPWVCSGLSFCRLGWAKDPGVSRPSSRFGGADNKGRGSAAPSDGAHPLVSRQRSCLRFADTGHVTTAIACFRPLVVMDLLCSIDVRVSWSERGVGLPPASFNCRRKRKHFCISFPTYQESTLSLDAVVLRACLFLLKFPVIFVYTPR